MSRRTVLIALSVFLFVATSLLLARALTGAGSERSEVLAVLRAQARGDAEEVLRRLPACAREPACVQTTRDRVARLSRGGRVEILNYDPSVRVALTRRLGTGRVAWRAGRSLPVVQCVKVRRDGPLTGGEVELVSVSNPIARDGSCRN